MSSYKKNVGISVNSVIYWSTKFYNIDCYIQLFGSEMMVIAKSMEQMSVHEVVLTAFVFSSSVKRRAVAQEHASPRPYSHA